MTTNRATAKPKTPALAVSVEQACAALGVSWDTWRNHVECDVRIVRLGRRKLVPVVELEKWLDQHAETAHDRAVVRIERSRRAAE